MVPIDFFLAIAIYLFLAIGLVIGWWIFYTYREDDSMYIESRYLQECPYCSYLFFDYRESELKICPRCESYIEAVS